MLDARHETLDTRLNSFSYHLSFSKKKKKSLLTTAPFSPKIHGYVGSSGDDVRKPGRRWPCGGKDFSD